MQKNYCYNNSKIIALIFIMVIYHSVADTSGIIINPDVVADTLDFGICMPGDELESTFILKNTGDKTLKIRQTRPSLSIERLGVPGHDNDHEEFSNDMISDSILIPPGDSSELKIKYEASEDTNIYNFGFRIARLTIGFYDSDFDIPPDSFDEYVMLRDIVLIAGKVRHHISGHTDLIDFDSVYISENYYATFKWKVYNVSKNNLIVDTQKTDWLSPKLHPEEFNIEGILPLSIPKKSGPVEWKIDYKPVDRLADSIFYSLGYRLNDSLIFSGVKIKGLGVKQDLFMNQSDAQEIRGDTLFIGKVGIGKSKEIYAVVGNSGNMNFGAVNQVIYDGSDGEEISEYYSITRKINEENHIIPTHGDTFRIRFEPDKKGIFNARYVIRTNIDKRRGIKAVPPNALVKIFYLKGEGIAPVFKPETDTIDFGSVVWHRECPTSKTITLRFSNIGNTDLQIYDILYESPFEVEYFKNTPPWILPPFNKDSIKIIFSPNEQSEYFSKIIFVTNTDGGNDSIKVYVSASRINPDSINLSIDKNLKVKPGNLISVPLITEFKKISKSRTFETELIYNKTLLRYIGFDKLGTACENADNNDFIISELNAGGRLSVKFHTPVNDVYFLKSDTLVKLIFRSYIGDNLSTPISIIEPLLGDGICNKILLPVVSNGILTIDSICGLPNLLLPEGFGYFNIGEFYPNPANDITKLQYSLKYPISLEVNLYNELGMPVKNIYKGDSDAGYYEIEVDCSNLCRGIYFIQFRSGFLIKSRKLIIIK